MTLDHEDLQSISFIFGNLFGEFEQRFEQKMDEKLDKRFREELTPIYNRLDEMQGSISALKNGQQKIRQELRQISDKLDDTYTLALDAWGQSTENRSFINQF